MPDVTTDERSLDSAKDWRMDRRQWGITVLLTLCEGAIDMTQAAEGDVVELIGSDAFQPTLRRLEHAIEAAGLGIFARIDHAQAARDVALDMPPTIVIFYGNPKVGTPVMLAAPEAALDLPLRFLLREAEDGKAVLSFRPIVPVLRQAGVPDAAAARLEPAQQLLVKAMG